MRASDSAPYISLHLPASPCISLHLPTSPYISLYLPTSPYISLHLPTSPNISRYLPVSPCISQVGGLLCASATDLGAMSGRFGEQCAARYGAQPLRSGAKIAPELALRMLLASTARAAGALGRRERPLLSPNPSPNL